MPSPSARRKNRARQQARRDTEAILAAAGSSDLAQLSAGAAGAVSAAQRLAAAGAESAETTALILALLAALAAARGGTDWITDVMEVEFADQLRSGEITDPELAEAAETERQREADFIQGMEKRLRRDIPDALKQSDPQAAIEAVIEREQRYMDQHDDAAAARVQALLQRRLVKRLSPDGAFWIMNPTVKEHTPDCEALAAVGWWPWEVLDRINPPVHTGCRCELLTRDEAIGMGYMGTELPDTTDAVRKANEIAQLYDLGEAEWRFEPPLDERDLMELYWNRRYPKGTIWGGRFMPKRGGFAPRISIREILRRLMGADAPDIASRGNQRTIAAPDPEDVMRTPSGPGGAGGNVPKGGQKLEGVKDRTAARLEEKVTAFGQTMDAIRIGAKKPDPQQGEGWERRGGLRQPMRDPKTGQTGSDISIGIDHIRDLEELSAKQASGQSLLPAEAQRLYEARRVITHELIHGSSAISMSDYATEEGFAMEEALTEELTHVILGDELVEEENIDLLRALELNPDDPVFRGTYRIQRAGLKKVLDLASVPEEDRRELLERLSFGTPSTEGRIAVLGKLIADANAVSQQKGEDVVRGAMFLSGADAGPTRDRNVGFLNAPELDGILTPQIRLPDAPTPDGFEIGDAVVIMGRGENDRQRDYARYAGRVIDLGFHDDGEPRIGVEVTLVDNDGKKIGNEIRFPNPVDVEKLASTKRKRLKGANVTGPVQKGDQVRILRQNGDLEVVKLDQIVAFSKDGYTIDVKTEMGQRVRIRSSQIKDIQRAKSKTRSRKARRMPKEPIPGTAKRVKAQMVSGPRGYDPRRYSDPRRGLLGKITALDPGDELLLADGSTIQRGVKGLATIERPDGSRRVYASPARLANAETEGIARRVGSKVTMNTPSDGDPYERGTQAFRNRQDAALDRGTAMATPSAINPLTGTPNVSSTSDEPNPLLASVTSTEIKFATPSYSPGDDHELLVGSGLMAWQEDPENANDSQLAAIAHEVVTGPSLNGPFYRGQPTDAPAPPQSGRMRGWSYKLDEATAFALQGPAVIDGEGRRRRAEGVLATLGELAPGEKLVATLYVTEAGGGLDIGKRLEQAEGTRADGLRKVVDRITEERLPKIRADYVEEMVDSITDRPTLEAARDALALNPIEDESRQALRLRIQKALPKASQTQIEDAVTELDRLDPLFDLNQTRMGSLNSHIANEMEEIAYEAAMEFGDEGGFENEYENEAEVILDNDRLDGLRRIDVLIAEGGDPEIAKLNMNTIRSKVKDAVESGEGYKLPDPPADPDPPPAVPDGPDFDEAVAIGASDGDFQMDDFTKGIMAKHGLMPGGSDSRELTDNEQRMASMATPSMLEKLADGEGPVEDLLRRALDAVGVDPYDIDFEELDRHATGHEMLPESRLNIAGRGVSPCATFRSVDFAVHVLLPEMLAEKYPELAQKLRSTSPRWGWRTGRLKPGIARPQAGMATPSFRNIPEQDRPQIEDVLRYDPLPEMAAKRLWSDVDPRPRPPAGSAYAYPPESGNDTLVTIKGGFSDIWKPYRLEIDKRLRAARVGDQIRVAGRGGPERIEKFREGSGRFPEGEWRSAGLTGKIASALIPATDVIKDSELLDLLVNDREHEFIPKSMATPSNLESRDAALDAVMRTPSTDGPVEEAELKRVIQSWTSWADDVRANPEKLAVLKKALDDAPEVEGPFYRGQAPDQAEPIDSLRSWTTDIGIGADFAADLGLERRRPDGTREKTGGLTTAELDSLQPGEELVATIFVADSAEGLSLPEIMAEPLEENDPHYAPDGTWMWAREGEHILKPETLKGYRKVEVVIARHGEYFPISDPLLRRSTIRRKVRDAVESKGGLSMATPSLDPNLEPKGMATPSFNLFNWTKRNRPGREKQVKRSELELPPAPVQGIPSYEGTKLTDVEPAGGSNGARIAVDENGNSWLVKPYRGDADRVATELLSNAVYRELGIRVPNAGVGRNAGPDGDQIAVSYPLIAGDTKRWNQPNSELADGFVADALLANWDVVGLEQDNILWNNGQPIRLDQGGTLEYRAMGGAKPFGPIPAELWTMQGVGGQARGRMDITEAGMRASARDAALRLPPERIDQLVDEAPFANEEMRERVRQSLKDRVAWLDRYGAGLEGLPEPLEADDAIDYLDERDSLLITEPEQDAALSDFMGDMRDPVEKHLQSNAPRASATPEVQEIVTRLDQLLRARETKLDDDLIAYASLPPLDNPDALRGRTVSERSFLPLSLRRDPEAQTLLRVQIPAGLNALSPSALGVVADPDDILLDRNSRIRVTSAVELPDGSTQLNAEIVPYEGSPSTPIAMLSRTQLLAALGLEDSDMTDAELRDRLRLKRGDA